MQISIHHVAIAAILVAGLAACNRNDAETDMPADGGLILDSPAVVDPGLGTGDTILDTTGDTLLNVPM